MPSAALRRRGAEEEPRRQVGAAESWWARMELVLVLVLVRTAPG